MIDINDVDLIVNKIEVEVGGNQLINISKEFGPIIFCDLKIIADLKENAWIIYREMLTTDTTGTDHIEWEEWARIPGRIPEDCIESKEECLKS